MIGHAPRPPVPSPEREQSNVVRLHPDDLAYLAELLAERLVAPSPPPSLVTAAVLAERLSVARSWVYEHADELGAVRVSDGPRAGLRFDPVKALEAVTARSSSVQSLDDESPASNSKPRQPRRPRKGANGASAPELLPIGPKASRS